MLKVFPPILASLSKVGRRLAIHAITGTKQVSKEEKKRKRPYHGLRRRDGGHGEEDPIHFDSNILSAFILKRKKNDIIKKKNIFLFDFSHGLSRRF